MDFAVALGHLRLGQKARRTAWRGPVQWVVLVNERFLMHLKLTEAHPAPGKEPVREYDTPWLITHDDIIEKDWEVLK